MNQVGSAGVVSVNEPLRDLMYTWVVPRRHFAPGPTLFLYSSGNVGGTARIRPSRGADFFIGNVGLRQGGLL